MWRSRAITRSLLIVLTRIVDATSMTGIPSNFSLIQRRMQETTVRHAVVSRNIANINTPGFKASEVISFADSLAKAGKAGEVGEVGDDPDTWIRPQEGSPTRLDGNNVDIDREMGRLTKNSLVHNAYTQILASKVRQMQSAISGR